MLYIVSLADSACAECLLGVLQPCPANTVTPDMVNPEETAADSEFHASVTTNAVTSMDQCSTIPGYGWDDGSAVPCTIGTYAPGYDNQVRCCLAVLSAVLSPIVMT
jgi:hypothetical protein